MVLEKSLDKLRKQEVINFFHRRDALSAMHNMVQINSNRAVRKAKIRSMFCGIKGKCGLKSKMLSVNHFQSASVKENSPKRLHIDHSILTMQHLNY